MNAFTFQVSSTSTCQWAAGDHVSLVRLEWVASWLAQPLTLPWHAAKDLSCQYHVWCRFHLLQLDLRSTLWLGCWGLVLLCDGSDDDYLACFLNRYCHIASLLLSFAQLVLPYLLWLKWIKVHTKCLRHSPHVHCCSWENWGWSFKKVVFPSDKSPRLGFQDVF